MRRPRVPGPCPELPERELHVSGQVEFDDPVGEASESPYMLVCAHQHAVRRDAGPLLEELAVDVEHLDAFVSAIGDEDARRRAADGDAVRCIELARPSTSAPPLQERLAGLVELHDAGVAVAV